MEQRWWLPLLICAIAILFSLFLGFAAGSGRHIRLRLVVIVGSEVRVYYGNACCEFLGEWSAPVMREAGKTILADENRFTVLDHEICLRILTSDELELVRSKAASGGGVICIIRDHPLKTRLAVQQQTYSDLHKRSVAYSRDRSNDDPIMPL